MRASWDHPRGPVPTRILVGFAADHGVAPEHTLAGTGLHPADLEHPETVLAGVQELLAVRNVLHRLGDRPGLGASLGARFALANHGDLGFALMTCATARAAFELAVRFLRVSDAFVDIRARADGDEIVLDLDPDPLPTDLRAFLLERDVTAIVAVVRALLPDLRLAIDLALPGARVAAVAGLAPEHAVRSGAASRMRGGGARLDEPLATADVTVARSFELRLQERLRHRAVRTPLAVRVRAVLLEDPARRPAATEVAAALHVAPRTLRRHLHDEGTSFQAVADAAHGDLAAALLAGGTPIADVAVRLGYADAVSFTRAFRRWTGSPPGAWARSRAATPGPSPPR